MEAPVTFLRFLHVLAILWFVAGVALTVLPVWQAWFDERVERKAMRLTDAQRHEATWLLPSLIATVFTGYAWAAAADYNVITTGWLVGLQVLTGVNVFIFVPLMGVGLRRVRMLALQADKQGEVTDALRDALADNVPLVFGTLIALTIPLMVWLPVFKPF
ncbi:MAG: DUF2269 family protein [Dehalococcoidia bacterium]|nr:DUF2269 family protein [Dehalococcoidia bacterium]